ncbi:MAG: ABC transporter substrate-binding protein [Actinobacteria bacterium]|nr:ABC transporter substrate-binding protein [Actinomycetota bacterium]
MHLPSRISLGPGARRTSMLFSAGVLAASILAACGSSSASGSATTASAGSTKAASSSPVIIHAILSETGQGGFLGSRQAKALQVLAKSVNSSGGIDGHPVQMDILDNETSPITAVSLANKLISEKVPFFLNGSIGAVDKAVDALSTPSGPFIYDLSPVEHPPAGSKIFSAGFSLSLEIQSDLNFFKSKGWTKIAALTSTDASGVAGYDTLQKELALPQFSSIHLVTHQTFGDSDVSVATQLSVIKADHPQALLTWATGTPLGTILNGMSSLGMDNLPTTADSGNGSFAEMKQYGSKVPKDLYIAIGSLTVPANQLPAGPVRNEVSKFQSEVSAAGGTPGLGWGLAWDPASLLIGALKRLGVNATSDQILKYMENLHNIPGVIGMYNTSTSNHRGLSTSAVYLATWNGNKFVVASGSGGQALGSSAS